MELRSGRSSRSLRNKDEFKLEGIMWNSLILDPMVNSLLWIYDVLANNFGLAIIVFTILVRLITYPLTAQQMKSTQKMQELQKSKKWQEMQKKNKENRGRIPRRRIKK